MFTSPTWPGARCRPAGPWAAGRATRRARVRSVWFGPGRLRAAGGAGVEGGGEPADDRRVHRGEGRQGGGELVGPGLDGQRCAAHADSNTDGSASTAAIGTPRESAIRFVTFGAGQRRSPRSSLDRYEWSKPVDSPRATSDQPRESRSARRACPLIAGPRVERMSESLPCEVNLFKSTRSLRGQLISAS